MSLKEGIVKDGKLFGAIGKTAATIGAGIILAAGAGFPVQNAVHTRMMDDTLHNRTGNYVEVSTPPGLCAFEQPPAISKYLGNISYLSDQIFMEVKGNGSKYVNNTMISELSESTNSALEQLGSYKADLKVLIPLTGQLKVEAKNLDSAVTYTYHDQTHEDCDTVCDTDCDSDGNCDTDCHEECDTVFDWRDNYWSLDIAKIGSSATVISQLLANPISLPSLSKDASLAYICMNKYTPSKDMNTDTKIAKNATKYISGRDNLVSDLPILLDSYSSFPSNHYERTFTRSHPYFEPEDKIENVYGPIYSMDVLSKDYVEADKLVAFLEDFRYNTLASATRSEAGELAQYLGDKSIGLIELAELPKGRGHSTGKSIDLWSLLAGIGGGAAAGGLGAVGAIALFDNYIEGNYRGRGNRKYPY